MLILLNAFKNDRNQSFYLSNLKLQMNWIKVTNELSLERNTNHLNKQTPFSYLLETIINRSGILLFLNNKDLDINDYYRHLTNVEESLIRLFDPFYGNNTVKKNALTKSKNSIEIFLRSNNKKLRKEIIDTKDIESVENKSIRLIYNSSVIRSSKFSNLLLDSKSDNDTIITSIDVISLCLMYYRLKDENKIYNRSPIRQYVDNLIKYMLIYDGSKVWLMNHYRFVMNSLLETNDIRNIITKDFKISYSYGYQGGYLEQALKEIYSLYIDTITTNRDPKVMITSLLVDHETRVIDFYREIQETIPYMSKDLRYVWLQYIVYDGLFKFIYAITKHRHNYPDLSRLNFHLYRQTQKNLIIRPWNSVPTRYSYIKPEIENRIKEIVDITKDILKY